MVYWPLMLINIGCMLNQYMTAEFDLVWSFIVLAGTPNFLLYEFYLLNNVAIRRYAFRMLWQSRLVNSDIPKLVTNILKSQHYPHQYHIAHQHNSKSLVWIRYQRRQCSSEEWLMKCRTQWLWLMRFNVEFIVTWDIPENTNWQSLRTMNLDQYNICDP